jgi:AcrR family transcriptional regulator
VRPPLTMPVARRDAIVAAAAAEFAVHGLHGVPTARIAERAGISHAYLFRFFPTKRELFVAASRQHLDRLEEACGVPSRREEVRGALGDDREALLGLLQALAGLADPLVGAAIRPRIEGLLAELGPVLSEGMLRAAGLTVVDHDLEDPSSCSGA